MLEFKLNYYFEMYKDKCVISSTKFKDCFIKRHGDFELLNELFIMIQRYQLETYGTYIGSGKSTFRNVKKGGYSRLDNQRLVSRFGTKEERFRRNLEYERNL